MIRDAMKRPATFGFYGESNTGKTSLIEKIINHLTKEGYKIATVKITNKKIGIDSNGKDTWRHGQAGSKLVVLSSPIETDFLFKNKQNIDEILQHIAGFGEHDLVIIEGANDEITPKIRIGNIPERENTILTYDGDFKGLINSIKNEII